MKWPWVHRRWKERAEEALTLMGDISNALRKLKGYDNFFGRSQGVIDRALQEGVEPTDIVRPDDLIRALQMSLANTLMGLDLSSADPVLGEVEKSEERLQKALNERRMRELAREEYDWMRGECEE